MARYINTDYIDWEKVEYEYGSRTEAVIACKIAVQETPTADVAPVIHSYLIDYLDRFKCANCDEEITNSYHSYCPSCGAVLEGIMGDKMVRMR